MKLRRRRLDAHDFARAQARLAARGWACAGAANEVAVHVAVRAGLLTANHPRVVLRRVARSTGEVWMPAELCRQVALFAACTQAVCIPDERFEWPRPATEQEACALARVLHPFVVFASASASASPSPSPSLRHIPRAALPLLAELAPELAPTDLRIFVGGSVGSVSIYATPELAAALRTLHAELAAR